MSYSCEAHSQPDHAFAKAALVLTLWISLGVFLALVAPKAGEILPALAAAPVTAESPASPNPI